MLHFGGYHVLTSVDRLRELLFDPKTAIHKSRVIDGEVAKSIEEALGEYSGPGDMTWKLDMASVEDYVNDMMYKCPYKTMFAHASVGDAMVFIRETICSILCERTEMFIHGTLLNDRNVDDTNEELLYLRRFLDLFVRFKTGCVAIKDQMEGLIQLLEEVKPCQEEIPDTFNMFVEENRLYLLALDVAFAFQNLLVEGSRFFYAQHEARLQSKIFDLLVYTNDSLATIIGTRFDEDWCVEGDNTATRIIRMSQQKTRDIMINRMKDWYNNKRARDKRAQA